MSYYIYDIESFPNIFTFAGKFVGSNEYQIWEISERINERDKIIKWMSYLQNADAEMVGFNNIGFDYPIMHEMMTNPYTFDAAKAYQLCSTIINAQGSGFNIPRIKPKDRFVKQIDLFKICHFDNPSKRTSLKALQFAMRSHSLEDLPFDIRNLTHAEMDQLKQYNIHDVNETEKFFHKCENLIDIRKDFLANDIVYGDVVNYSDVKIGGEYLTKKIGRAKCFSGGKARQTFREVIDFNKIILSKIYFRTELFDSVLSWFKSQRLYIKSSAPKPKLEIELGGLEFDFGVGGIHAIAKDKIYHSTDTHQIIDVDVAGMYPAVAIANGFAPEHLGEDFIVAYKQIQMDRKQYPKGTSMNAILKLAGNGVYGNSNNQYSCFYDPQYMFSVTINGQLQLLQLVEMLSLIPGLELIQVNTDGITAVVPNEVRHLFKLWCDIWEDMTGLVLEEVLYSRMWIRDVNNYMSEGIDGKIKSKGAYWYPACEKEYEGWWNKDFSNIASRMAVEKVLTHSWPVEVAIRLIVNPFDFMLRYKATGDSRLYIGDEKQLKTVRYYVSKTGKKMKKVSPPKGKIGAFKRANSLKDDFFNKILAEVGDSWDKRIHTKNGSTYQIVETSVQAGWLVKQCNVATDFDWSDVDWDYYIQEAKKLIIGSK